MRKKYLFFDRREWKWKDVMKQIIFELYKWKLGDVITQWGKRAFSG